MGAAARRDWIDVDLDGLRQTLARRGKAWLLYELVQNCWDTAATRVRVVTRPIASRPLVELTITDDDPDGFKDLTHAYTLFAPSEKKADPSKRGRWNAGEKMVLALCDEARIVSTTGTVIFELGGRYRNTKKRESGTEFFATVRMTRTEHEEILEAAKLLLPPIPLLVNGETIPMRTPIAEFTAVLPTEMSDENGDLRKTRRSATVRVYDRSVCPDGVTRIYEMGIPVVATDDPWTVEVMQKVPLNSDRDNVTPAYLRELRVVVLNHMKDRLTKEDATSTAVQDALTDPGVDAESIENVLTLQYGEKRAVYDPTDLEANNRFVAAGGTIIHGGAFSKDAWANIRRANAAAPSGRLMPTPKPYSDETGAEPARFVEESEWTPGMAGIASYACDLASLLIKRSIRVHFERGRMTDGWVANYGSCELTFNFERLGKAWFDQGPTEAVNALLIHEFAHEFEGNHLSADFYKALQTLGAKMVQLALSNPKFFQLHGWK